MRVQKKCYVLKNSLSFHKVIDPIVHSFSLSPLCLYTQTHTHLHAHARTHRAMKHGWGAKFCNLGPLSQQVDEDNWIRCVWSLRPRDQSRGKSSQRFPRAHACTHSHKEKEKEKMRTPCRPSEAAAWLIKAAWHPFWPPGAAPMSPGLSLGHNQESSLTSGHRRPSASTHHHPTTPGGMISWNTASCEWNMRSLYQHQQPTPVSTRTMLLSHKPSERKVDVG